MDGGVTLPEDANKYFDAASPDFSWIYGDFEICPVEPDVPGQARRVEVNGFEKLVVQNLKDSRPPFRLVSTWPEQDRLRPGKPLDPSTLLRCSKGQPDEREEVFRSLGDTTWPG